MKPRGLGATGGAGPSGGLSALDALPLPAGHGATSRCCGGFPGSLGGGVAGTRCSAATPGGSAAGVAADGAPRSSRCPELLPRMPSALAAEPWLPVLALYAPAAATRRR